MKNIAFFMAAYLFFGSFFPLDDYTQAPRLVDLARHFRLHVQESRAAGQEVSFQQFLQMHYLNTQIHQGDHEQDHDRLPFQQITPTIDQLVPLTWKTFNLTLPVAFRIEPYSTCTLFSVSFPFTVFHPPIA